jgi:hypothetical protein
MRAAPGNLLEIRVVNLWPNRLIGDAALPKEKRLTRTNVEFDKNTPLLESGLLGPVTLQAVNAKQTGAATDTPHEFCRFFLSTLCLVSCHA